MALFARYRCTSIVFASLAFLGTILILAIPAWFDADLPQDGEEVPTQAGLFQICLEAEKVADIEDAECFNVGWSLASDNDENDDRIKSDVRRMFIQFMICRIAVIITLIDIFAVLLRLIWCVAYIGTTIDLTVAACLIIVTNSLMIDMNNHPHEVFRMYNFVGAIDYSESDQTGIPGLQEADPTMTFGVSWFLSWAVLFLILLTGLSLYLTRKHQLV